jgi:aminoglycoside phosphotransferase family enzyme
MSDALPSLITALLDPSAYPHTAGRVQLVETHASWLLLAGDFAYKIKKPVTLPFLDYGTLAKRETCCRAELVLNHRLAPELYLDVVPIGGKAERPRIGELPALEWAVRMNRFDESGRLDHLAARNELLPAHLAQLAETLCRFHGAADAAEPGARYGAPDQVLAVARENFLELRQLLPSADQPQVERLARWTEGEFARRANDFAARKEDGFIREGHGDLHLGNLVLIAGRVTPFDCIEFNEDFRWNDPASEIAFVWIDLLDHGRPGWRHGSSTPGWKPGAISAPWPCSASMRFIAPWCAPRSLLCAQGRRMRSRRAASSGRRVATSIWHCESPSHRHRPSSSPAASQVPARPPPVPHGCSILNDPQPAACCASARTLNASACSDWRHTKAADRRPTGDLHARGDGTNLCAAA